MTVGVVQHDERPAADLIALACETVGIDCLVFRSFAHATRVLHAIRVDAFILDLATPGVDGLDWLETANELWPGLPRRTLLLAGSALAPGDAERASRLGAEIVSRPRSVVDAIDCVVERLQRV